ncbi:probably inactive leucine-rich repeat receptor-like protein kinase IMK2 [Macadamia integrifolia]|uniref:probably inactive leucine-rich repeat receptor-like protein kinase IMK2 n=1 Tax=Macadamia integrifolia TaxID=60698 RepID=UPI001C4F4EA2|nr:probably inactive leucine-rich repeat receptor-like protein kinase IMK2 [Macadamia integrifolia]
MSNQNWIFSGFNRYPLELPRFLKKTTVAHCRIASKKEKWKNSRSSGNHPLQHFGLPKNFFLCKRLLLLLQLLTLVFQSVTSQVWDGVIVTQADYQALQAFKHELIDPKRVLRSWNDSGYGACSGVWVGIKCVKGQVIVIQLPWKGLSGRISQKIGQLQALRKLSLHDNDIGGMIPSSLGFLPNLRGVSLFNNRLSGSIPPSLGSCPLLQTLDVSNNSLTGIIPASLANSTNLYRLNLSFNSLIGPIPAAITSCPSLTFLALQYNNLSGSIPDNWEGTKDDKSHQLQSLTLDHNSFSKSFPVSLTKLVRLEEISLSHNQINGTIPNEIGRLLRLRRLDLSDNAIQGSFPASLCNLSSLVQLNLEGNRLDNRIPEDMNRLSNLSILNLSRNQFNGQIPVTVGNISILTQLDLSQNRLTGDIPASLTNLTSLISFNVSYNNLSGPVPSLLSRKFNSTSFIGNPQLCGYSVSIPCHTAPPPSAETAKARHRKLTTKDIILIAAGALLAVLLLLCCILLCCLIRKRAASKAKNGETGGRAAATGGEKGAPAIGTEVESGGEAGGKLVHFDGPLLFTADDLLCATAEIMGKSTYGTVYKATLEDGSQVAVKRLREKLTKSQREFEVEVNAVGKIRHPNLLALRAYYLGPKGEKLLVFDFMPKGSLASFLHTRGPDTPMDWQTRMNIAMGITRGLWYLHKNENIVHGNLTSNNILLDENTNAKIADYGLSRLMTTAANSNVIATAGALGYRAPELSKLKKANTKTDIYSLGVILLELLTGKSPGEAMNGVDLPQWVASIVKEEWTNEVFDLELMRDASTTGNELLNTLKLALHCVDPSPASRPEVQQVLQQLEEIKPELAAASTSSGDDGAGVPSTSE